MSFNVNQMFGVSAQIYPSQSDNNFSSADTDSEKTNRCYSVLLGFAENFRTMIPPNIRLTVHCLKSIFFFKLPVEIEAKTHLQLGKLLFQHSKSEDQIRYHLLKAKDLGMRLKGANEYIKFEAAEVLVNFHEKTSSRLEAFCVLNEAIQMSNNNPYWHCRLLFKISKLHLADGDVNSACEMLTLGSEYARIHNSYFTIGLFILSKALVSLYSIFTVVKKLLLSSRQMVEVKECLHTAQEFIDLKVGSPYQQESILIFYLVIDVSYHLICGRAKSAHKVLKQLHQSIQRLARLGDSSQNNNVSCPEIDRFEWMPQEYMVILVYLVTVVQLMQSGMLERAQRSADKALTQIEKLCDLDSSPLLTIFHINLLEHTAMGRIVMGLNTSALEDISKACKLCQANPQLLVKRLPQLHTLLGLYSMSMNLMNEAESHFILALNQLMQRQQRLTDRLPRNEIIQRVNLNDSVVILICLNLSLVYIRLGNLPQCEFLINRIFHEAQSMLDGCHCLKAASLYVYAFLTFCQNRFPQSKQFLRDTVNLGNEEELNRISASALITMGQIHFNENSLQESKRVISAAISVAEKLPDIGIQLWATALLKEIAKSLGETQEEAKWFSEHDRYSKMVIADYYKASSALDHQILVNWMDGPMPMLSMQQNAVIPSDVNIPTSSSSFSAGVLI